MNVITELRERQLHEAVDQLTDENQSYLLGVLEALLFLQDESDISDLEPETTQQQVKGF